MDTTNLSEAEELLLQMVPEDGTAIGNKALQLQFEITVGMQDEPIDTGQFETLKQSLLDKGFVVKGKGRGGSIRRAVSGKADFDLESQVVQPELPTQPTAKKKQGKALNKTRRQASPPSSAIAIPTSAGTIPRSGW